MAMNFEQSFVIKAAPDAVWAYLTDSDLRRQWLASGDMDLAQDAPFSLTWRNDELTNPPGARPEAVASSAPLSPPRRLPPSNPANDVPSQSFGASIPSSSHSVGARSTL